MKKAVVFVLALGIILAAAGCSPKEAPSEPSASVKPSEEAVVTPGLEPSAEISQTPGPEPSEEPSVSPSAGDVIDYLELGFGLMENDGMGSVKIDMTENELTALLGEPTSKTEPLVWGADGMEHLDWVYGTLGLEIGMWKAPDSSDEAVIFSIRAVSPCTLTTQRGIKIGDTKEAAEQAYATEINEEDSSIVENGIVAGSVYGGMIFHLTDGKVSSIFIGAAAE